VPVLMGRDVAILQSCLFLLQGDVDQFEVPAAKDVDMLRALELHALLFQDCIGSAVAPEIEQVQVVRNPIKEICERLSAGVLHPREGTRTRPQVQGVATPPVEVRQNPGPTKGGTKWPASQRS
jgi:hypothetical protein